MTMGDTVTTADLARIKRALEDNGPAVERGMDWLDRFNALLWQGHSPHEATRILQGRA